MGVGKSCLLHQFTEKKCEWLLDLYEQCMITVRWIPFVKCTVLLSWRYNSWTKGCGHIAPMFMLFIFVGSVDGFIDGVVNLEQYA